MKKIIIIILCIFLLPITVHANEDLASSAGSAILIEASNGTVLFEKNANERYPVASLTKMVGQILILEAIENKSISWDDEVTASANASAMGGTQIWLEPGEVMSVRELMKGISMASANDAIVAMAEKIGGTEKGFVQLMNDKVKELGLKNTNFVNPTGLDENGAYSTAYDMAMIAKELVSHEEIFEFSSNYEDYLRTNTSSKFWLVNTNKLIRTYEGCDGLKTGFTDAAKYTMAATAKRDNLRLIAIVLQESVSKVRNQETVELLDYGFNLYEVSKIKDKGEIVGTLEIDKGDIDRVNILTKEEIVILKKKSDPGREYTSELKLINYRLPLKEGDVVGKLDVKADGKVVETVDVVVDRDVSKANIFKVFGKMLKTLIMGKLN